MATREEYDEIKTKLNKLHDVLYSTDGTIKKRFIDNPEKEKLPRKDVEEMLTAISRLESHLPVVKALLTRELIHQVFDNQNKY